MKRLTSLFLMAWVLGFGSGCGKNQGYYPAGYSPYTQAPGFPGGYNAYPTGGYPASPRYGGFVPQLPAGYPAAYTPFLPIDYYMRQNPQTAAYWPGFWNGWTTYAYSNGYSPYDFNQFWYGYAPAQWSYGSWNQLYGYLNQNFYSWATPYSQVSPQVNPQAFWANYAGYGYGNAWNYHY